MRTINKLILENEEVDEYNKLINEFDTAVGEEVSFITYNKLVFLIIGAMGWVILFLIVLFGSTGVLCI